MPKRGEQYVSMKRVATLVKQAEARGRANLVDELRAKLGLSEWHDNLPRLTAWVNGALWASRIEEHVGKLPTVLRALDLLADVKRALDQEVTNDPGF